MDSAPLTREHIENVRIGINKIIDELLIRAENHDKSKLEEPEKSTFDKYTPKLKTTTFGSEEYQKCLDGMKIALQHHYQNNRHHPEFHENGIQDMNLIDIIELFVDWYSATKRHDDGNIFKSVETSQKRFGFSDELKSIFINTANWIKEQY